MTRIFQEVVLLVVMVFVAVAASAQTGTTASTAKNGSVSCLVMALHDAALGSPHAVDLCHGVVVLDYTGEAWVQLPDEFDSQAKEFRYQLTPIGQPSPQLYLAS